MTKKTHSPSKDKKKRRSIASRMDVPKMICVHLIGEEHTLHHRIGVGLIMMTVGVLISKFAEGGYYFIRICGDICGYAIHGIGTIPIGEALVRKATNIKNRTPTIPDLEEIHKVDKIEEEQLN